MYCGRDQARCHARPRPAGLSWADQCLKLPVWISDERQPRSAFAHLVRRALGFDPLLAQSRERAVEIVDAGRDVPVAGPEVVGAAVVVVGQPEHRLLAAEREEVVRGLQLAVADDVESRANVKPSAS